MDVLKGRVVLSVIWGWGGSDGVWWLCDGGGGCGSDSCGGGMMY